MKIEIIPNEKSIFKILSEQWTHDHPAGESVFLKKIIYYTRANLVKLLVNGCEKYISKERKNLESHFYSKLKKEVNSVFVFMESEDEPETNYSKLCFIQRAFLREKVQGKLPYWFNTDYVSINDSNSIELKIQNDFQKNTLIKNERFKRLLKKIVGKIKLAGYKFVKEKIDIDQQLKEREIEIAAKKLIENTRKNGVSIEIVEKSSEKNFGELLGRKIKSDGILVSEIDKTFQGKAIVNGKIFHIERDNIFNDKKDVSKKKGILSFFISDEKDSIEVVVFYLPEEWDSSVVTPGLTVKIRGQLEISEFSGEQILKASAINIIDESALYKKDEEEKAVHEKRIEFHLHTKMSMMDSILDIKDMFKAAGNKGLHAFAVTDHGVVQSYPFISKYSSEFSMPGIYGLEAYVINDEEYSVMLSHKIPCLGNLAEEEFVIFDLETTGFSPRCNRIIEIGAVKVKNWSVISRFSQFIGLEGDALPTAITELTGITEKMLEGNPGESQCLEKFLEFAGNGILVAHNSDFDVNFVNFRLRKYRFEELKNTVIDTFRLSQIVFKDFRRFGLDALCQKLKITLESHHRAINDAEATYFLFREITKKIEKDDICDVRSMAQKLVLNDYRRIRSNHILIIARTQAGMKDIYKIVSESHIKYFYKNPRVPGFMIEQARSEGSILVGSACESGEIIQSYIKGASDEVLYSIADKFDFIEIQPLRNNRFMIDKGIFRSIEDIREMNRKLVDVADALGKICIATCDAHMLYESDNFLRKILQFGQKYKDYEKSQPLPVMNTTEMLKEFSYLGEKKCREVVIENTFKLYDMIAKEITPIPKDFFPPVMKESEKEITRMSYQKLERVYGTELHDLIRERVDKEINAIVGNGFSALYLIAQKLVKKSNDDGYIVGSRGSVGSSFVAWLMDITEVNPLPSHYLCEKCKKVEFSDEAFCGVDLIDRECPECGMKYQKCGYDIPFEVFMGFNGDKTPDIDLNFSGDYQRDIHNYTRELFGDKYVYKAGTIGTISDKTAETFVRKYYEENGVPIRKPEIKRVSGQLKGIKRTTGQHPGGLIIVPKDNDILNFSPIQFPANDTDSDVFTTHFDYHVMDEQLVKLDLLGHDNPTSIRELENITGVSASDIPLDDPATMKLFSCSDSLNIDMKKEQLPIFLQEVGTLAIPEFGTKFVRDMLVDTRPTTFAELVRISGLSHGTDVWLNNAQTYVRKGLAKLSEVISVRDDIMNYLIYNGIEKGVAFSIMEFIRKGKPSKDPEKWNEYAELMRNHGVKDWYIDSCKKIKYMFPKAHAVAYVLMSFRIAYFKVHYPLEFYAVYFSLRLASFNPVEMSKDMNMLRECMKLLLDKEKDNHGVRLTATEKDKISLLEVVIEARLRGIKIDMVDINSSLESKFIVNRKRNSLIPPLATMPGLGEKVAGKIVEERSIREFSSISDFKRRTGCGKNVIDIMKDEGVFANLAEDDQGTLF